MAFGNCECDALVIVLITRKSDITKEYSIQDNSTVLIMQRVKSSNSARFWIGRQTRSNSCQVVQRGQGRISGEVRTHCHAVRSGLIRTKHFTTVRDLFGTVLEVIRKSPATQESELPFLPVSIKPNIYRSGATRFARRAPQKMIVFCRKKHRMMRKCQSHTT